MNLNYIIVDEDVIMHRIIENYCNDIEYMTLVAHCYSSADVMTAIESHKIDTIFIDINLQRLNGLEFIKRLKNPVKLIVITGHKDKYLEGYELKITDYLLKPFTLERFKATLEKLQKSFLYTLESVKESK